MNLSVMRASVRRDLKDEDGSNYRWSDDEIDRAIGRALEEFSLSCPAETVSELVTVTGSDEVDISSLSGRIAVQRVEFPSGARPRRYIRFEVHGDMLIMLETTGNGEICRIYWTCLHTLDASVSTIPQRYEGLVALGACAYAALSLSQYATDRATYGGEDVDRDYLRWANGRMREFKRGCRRSAAVLREGQLY